MNVASAATKTSSNCFYDDFTHVIVEHLVEKLTWLLVVGVRVIVGIASDNSIMSSSMVGVALVFDRATKRIRLVVDF